MATFSFEIEDSEIAIMLRDDLSFARLLREKILDMKNLPDMKDALIEAAKSQVVSHLKNEVLENLFEKIRGTRGNDYWTVLKEEGRIEINDMIKEQMHTIVSEMIKERDEMIQEKVKEGVKKLLTMDVERVMVQAAKELLNGHQNRI